MSDKAEAEAPKAAGGERMEVEQNEKHIEEEAPSPSEDVKEVKEPEKESSSLPEKESSSSSSHSFKKGDSVHALFMSEWHPNCEVGKTSGKCVHVNTPGVLGMQHGCKLVPGHSPVPEMKKKTPPPVEVSENPGAEEDDDEDEEWLPDAEPDSKQKDNGRKRKSSSLIPVPNIVVNEKSKKNAGGFSNDHCDVMMTTTM